MATYSRLRFSKPVNVLSLISASRLFDRSLQEEGVVRREERVRVNGYINPIHTAYRCVNRVHVPSLQINLLGIVDDQDGSQIH